MAFFCYHFFLLLSSLILFQCELGPTHFLLGAYDQHSGTAIFTSVPDIGLISRKTAISVTPVSTLTCDEDGLYTYSMSTTFRTVKFSFRIGEEFIEERADGRKVKSIMTIEGDNLIQVQTEDNGRRSTHVRHFSPELVTVTTTVDGWDGKCIRIYEVMK